jgi:hypothetical protein
MSSVACGKSIIVAEHRNDAMLTDSYASRLQMVLAELDNGRLGDGAHGNEAHIDALKLVLAGAQKILDKIQNPPPRECNRHKNCDEADAKARERGQFGADHCHDDCCEDCFGS